MRISSNALTTILTTILLSAVLLFLFHFETVSIGPVKVSHLWKGIILAFLIVAISREKKLKFFIYRPLLYISVLQLANIELFNNPLNAVLLFSVTLVLPLIGMYAFKFTPKQLQNSLLYFSSFFILSFVPYQIGLLSSLGSAYELLSYGSDDKGLVGPFSTPHAASTVLATSLLIVVFFWLSNAYNKWFLSVLFTLGFYFLFLTYVRLGMAMFAIGLLPIAWFFGKQSLVKFLRLAIVLSFSTLFIFSWVLSNETMVSRITGERVINRISGDKSESSETESFEQLGSSRGMIYLASLQIYAEANIAEKIIGVGKSEAKRRMAGIYGDPVITHNGFLQLLLNNGVLGLLIFLSFIRNIYKLQKGMHQLDSRILIQSLLLAYMTMTFFQHYNLLYAVLLLMLSIAYCYKTQLIRNRLQI
jgi:hypothetical protein